MLDWLCGMKLQWQRRKLLKLLIYFWKIYRTQIYPLVEKLLSLMVILDKHYLLFEMEKEMTLSTKSIVFLTFRINWKINTYHKTYVQKQILHFANIWRESEMEKNPSILKIKFRFPIHSLFLLRLSKNNWLHYLNQHFPIYLNFSVSQLQQVLVRSWQQKMITLMK